MNSAPMPLVSIIIPVYNAEKYLSKCIDSIVNQEYKNWELILVDDGSNDDSLEICRRYETQYNCIRCICQDNMGSSVARNRGLDDANGKYISFVDADDWVDSHMIYELVTQAEKEDAPIVICNHFHVYEDGRKILQPKSNYGIWKMMSKGAIDIYLQKYLCKGIRKYKPYLKMGQPWGRIYLKTMLDENCIRFPIGLARTEDGIFNMYAAECASKILFLDEGLYYYRVFEDSISHCYYPNIVSNTERDFEEVRKFASIYKMNDELFLKGIDARITTWFYKYLVYLYFSKEYLQENGYMYARKQALSIRNQDMYNNAYKNVDLRILNRYELIFVLCMKYRLLDIVFIMVKIRERVKCVNRK